MSRERIGLSGTPLVEGARLVRVVYIDEAGVAKEPWLVEAGVIVNPDEHVPELEARFAAIRAELCPEVPENAPFHATDVWHGCRAFDRAILSREIRHEILRRIAEIPAEMGLPIVAGVQEKGRYRNFDPGVLPKDIAWFRQNVPTIVAFASCVFTTEMWLRQHAKNEVAMLIHEVADMAGGLRNSLRLFQDGALAEAAGMPEFFPLKRISRDVLFMEKHGHGPMQLADMAAFLIRRKLSGKIDSEPQFSLLASQIVPEWQPDRFA